MFLFEFINQYIYCRLVYNYFRPDKYNLCINYWDCFKGKTLTISYTNSKFDVQETQMCEM